MEYPKKIEIQISEDVINSIFDECDRYNSDETGGRLLGFYEIIDQKLILKVYCDIGPGPKAKRDQTSFFQDGNYQEKIFRKIESLYPSVEHLGNWHTHHVNGFETLSNGDISTYFNIVNNSNHNTDFFYALLITKKNNDDNLLKRYKFKNYIFIRDSQKIIEVPEHMTDIVDVPKIRSEKKENNIIKINTDINRTSPVNYDIKQKRYYDNLIVERLYQTIKPFISKRSEKCFWKGEIRLINDEKLQLIIYENIENGKSNYMIVLPNEFKEKLKNIIDINGLTFDSLTEGVITLERIINKSIFLNNNFQKK